MKPITNEAPLTNVAPELAWAVAVLAELFASGHSGTVTVDFPGNGAPPKVRDSRVRKEPKSGPVVISMGGK